MFSVYIVVFGRSLSVFLSAVEADYGADYLECHHPACMGHTSDQVQSAYSLTNLLFFYDKVPHWVEKGMDVNAVYGDFTEVSKVFDSSSHSILWRSWLLMPWVDELFAG